MRQPVWRALRALLVALLIAAVAGAPVSASNNRSKWQQKPYGVYLHYIGYDFLSSVPTGAWRSRIVEGANTWNAEGRELYFANVSTTSPHDYNDITYEDLAFPNGDALAIATPISWLGEIYTGAIAFNTTPYHSSCGAIVWYTGTATTGLPPCSADLRSVAVHEFGHLVMLAHSSISADVMYSTIPISGTKRSLGTHDRDMIRWMYPAK